MAFPTFLMGCLPTYKQIGGWSTTLLLCCRILQGMSVGGQLPASLIYTVETKPRNRWGFYGSLVMVRYVMEYILGSIFRKDNSVALGSIIVDGFKHWNSMRESCRSTSTNCVSTFCHCIYVHFCID